MYIQLMVRGHTVADSGRCELQRRPQQLGVIVMMIWSLLVMSAGPRLVCTASQRQPNLPPVAHNIDPE